MKILPLILPVSVLNFSLYFCTFSIIPGEFREDHEEDGLDLGASPLASISTELGLIDGKTAASIGGCRLDRILPFLRSFYLRYV